jgi:hypothetical protein
MGDTLTGKRALAAYEKASKLEPTNASYFFKVGTTISKYLDGVAHQLPYY